MKEISDEAKRIASEAPITDQEQMAQDIENYALNCLNRLKAECINVTHPGVQYKIKAIDLNKFL